MKEPSLKKILLDYLNEQETWVTKGQLAVIAENEGFLGESAGRALRDLEVEGKILVSYYKSKRNIDLARYARLHTLRPTKMSSKIVIVKDALGNDVAMLQGYIGEFGGYEELKLKGDL